MVVLIPTRKTVDIRAYFFKLNRVICGPFCTIFSELKHIIPLLPFPQHIKGLFKKRNKNHLDYLSRQAHLSLCGLLSSTRLCKLMWTGQLYFWLQITPSKVLIRGTFRSSFNNPYSLPSSIA